jgi:hypothetical protein
MEGNKLSRGWSKSPSIGGVPRRGGEGKKITLKFFEGMLYKGIIKNPASC